MFPDVREDNFYNKQGQYKVDKSGSETMLNCLMYKLIYYRFSEVRSGRSEETGFDTVRDVAIGNRDFKLKHFEEAYTTERWLVRIYRVLPLAQMDPPMTSRFESKTVSPLAGKMTPF